LCILDIGHFIFDIGYFYSKDPEEVAGWKGKMADARCRMAEKTLRNNSRVQGFLIRCWMLDVGRFPPMAGLDVHLLMKGFKGPRVQASREKKEAQR
jgi:hypothetical protein